MARGPTTVGSGVPQQESTTPNKENAMSISASDVKSAVFAAVDYTA